MNLSLTTERDLAVNEWPRQSPEWVCRTGLPKVLT